MRTVPDFNTLVVAVGPALAAVASLAAVVGVIAQLTKGSRLRSLASTFATGDDRELKPGQQAVLDSLHTDALAKIIAREAVPPRRFLWPAIAVAVFLTTSALVGLDIEPGLSPEDVWWFIGGALLGSLVLGLLPGAGFAWMYQREDDRKQIADGFRRGQAPLQAVGGWPSWRNLLTGWTTGAATVLVAQAIGTIWAEVARALELLARGQAGDTSWEVPLEASVLIIFVAVFLWLGIMYLLRRFMADPAAAGPWRHPMV